MGGMTIHHAKAEARTFQPCGMCSALNPNWEAVKTPLDDCTSATVSADPAGPVTYPKPPHKRLIDQDLLICESDRRLYME